MIDADEIKLAKRLPKGSRRALFLLTEKFTLPGRDTFNANAAFNLTWRARKLGGLAEYRIEHGRAAYRITPLGARIRGRLASADERLCSRPLAGSTCEAGASAVPPTAGDAQPSGDPA